MLGSRWLALLPSSRRAGSGIRRRFHHAIDRAECLAAAPDASGIGACLLARTDGLTGLINPRTFGVVPDQEWRRARRSRSAFSLLFLDGDRFKASNDAYGHHVGDDALAAVVRCIGNSVRYPHDSAASYGGEEIVVLLPDTPITGAAKIADKIRTSE